MLGVPKDDLDKNAAFLTFNYIFDISVAGGEHCTKIYMLRSTYYFILVWYFWWNFWHVGEMSNICVCCWCLNQHNSNIHCQLRNDMFQHVHHVLGHMICTSGVEGSDLSDSVDFIMNVFWADTVDITQFWSLCSFTYPYNADWNKIGQ